MYINGNKEDLEKFKNSFGDEFYDVLGVIEQVNNMRLYLLYGKRKEILSEGEMKNAIILATQKVKKIKR